MLRTSLVAGAATAILMLLAGCGRDAEALKRRYLEDGNKSFEKGKYEAAIQRYRKAVEQDPGFGEAYLKLGDAELRQGNIREAVGSYRQAAKLMPKQDEAARKLAGIYLTAYGFRPNQGANPMSKQLDELVELMAKADPSGYQVCRVRGFIAAANEDMPEAVAQFTKADKIKPGQLDLLHALMQVLYLNKQSEQAEKLALRLVRESPSYAGSYGFLAGYYLMRNRPGKAESVLKQRVAALPQDSRSHMALAIFYLAANRRAEADRTASEMPAAASPTADARMNPAQLYSQVRDTGRAGEIMDRSWKSQLRPNPGEEIRPNGGWQ